MGFRVQSTFLGFQKLRRARFWLVPAEEEAFKRGAVRTARGKPWADAELKLLMDMAAQGFNPQQIFDSGKLPGRTLRAIGKQAYCSIVRTFPTVIVHTIEPALRAFTKQHQLTSDACPYFSEKETMERYLRVEAEAVW
jgi:hypothetical protein